MINAIIIEDEKDGQLFLQSLLQKLCPHVQIIGMAESVVDGYDLIQDLQPQLVFLDVQLSGGTGFDLLERFTHFPFKVIFITAYKEFALRAIKFSALDYLLKPIDPLELVEAVAKAQTLESQLSGLKTLMTNLQSTNGFTRIAIPSESMVKYVEIAAILRCRAEGNYTWCYLADETKIISTKLLKEYEEVLRDHAFFRVHRSHLINLKRVREYRRQQQDLVILEDGTKIEVSRNKKTDFLKAMGKI